MLEFFFQNLWALGGTGVFAVLFLGLCIGSFLNVVIYRLPVMLQRDWTTFAEQHLAEVAASDDPTTPSVATPSALEANPDAAQTQETFNLAVPRSRCPKCDNLITAWQNIPVISWLVLRGKCKNCKTPISFRYPGIELLTSIMSLVVIGCFGFTGLGLATLIFTWCLIAATFIDFDTQLLPDQITLPLLWLGLLVNLGGNGIVPLETAVIGAIAGYMVLWLTFWAFKLLTGKDGLGYGDFKLLGALGAWMGWQVLPGILLIASLVGLIYALGGMALKRLGKGQPIAFGPYLAVAGWVCLIFRDNVLSLFAIG